MGSNFASFPTTRFRCVAFCRQETEMAGLPGAASTAHSAIEKMSAATITAPSLVAHLAPTTRRATSERARAAARASHTREAVAIEESSSVSRRASLFSAAAAAGLAAFAVPPTACASAAASLEQVVELTPENFAAEVDQHPKCCDAGTRMASLITANRPGSSLCASKSFRVPGSNCTPPVPVKVSPRAGTTCSSIDYWTAFIVTGPRELL